ncbi:UNVERIFIED_ORG: hypothetical protein ABIB19_003823 [Arthrobacter sp. UYEF10]
MLSSLGLESAAVLDDASFFPSTRETREPEGIPTAYIAATFAPASGAMNRNDYHRHMARLLDLAHEQLQLPIILIPHVSTIGEKDGDQESHAAIARLVITNDIRVLEQKPAAETAVLTGDAELIITSRYHPVIFGLAGGVPVLPVAVDYYGEVRIGGALENWGLAPTLRSLRHLGEDADTKWASSIIEARDDIRQHLKEQGQQLRRFHALWWDHVADVLKGSTTERAYPQLPAPDPRLAARLEGSASTTADRLNASNETAIGLLAQHGDWLQGLDELEQHVHEPHSLTGFTAYAHVMTRLHKSRKVAAWARKALTGGK